MKLTRAPTLMCALCVAMVPGIRAAEMTVDAVKAMLQAGNASAPADLSGKDLSDLDLDRAVNLDKVVR